MAEPLVGFVIVPQEDFAVTHDNWQSAFLPLLPAKDVFADLDFVSNQIGWLGGRFGTMLKTTDAGFSWQKQVLPGFDSTEHDELHDIRALTPELAYASTIRSQFGEEFARIYRTIDGGETWVALDTFTTQPDNQLGHWIGEIDALPTGGIWAASRVDGFIFAAEAPSACGPDCNGDGELNVLDFVCFQDLFVDGDVGADCNFDGELNILDFVCFQGAFAGGCR